MKKFFVLCLAFSFAIIGSSFYQSEKIMIGDEQSKQMLKDKCVILENTIELALKIMEENEKQYKAEMIFMQSKVDCMYRELIYNK